MVIIKLFSICLIEIGGVSFLVMPHLSHGLEHIFQIFAMCGQFFMLRPVTTSCFKDATTAIQ